MKKTYNKFDDHILEVVEPQEDRKMQYHYDWLLLQREQIKERRDADTLQRDKEISELDALISEADKLGIVAKSPEVVNGEIKI